MSLVKYLLMLQEDNQDPNRLNLKFELKNNWIKNSTIRELRENYTKMQCSIMFAHVSLTIFYI